MREQVFQSEWRDSWRHHHPACHIVKIPDMPRSADARFNPVKPYDYYAVLHARFYAMELKLKTKVGGFPFKDITEGQLNNLEEARKNGAHAIVVINYRVQEITGRQRKKNSFLPAGKRFNTVFVIEVDKYLALDKAIFSKSIPLEVLFESWVIRVERVGKFWDIPSLTGAW